MARHARWMDGTTVSPDRRDLQPISLSGSAGTLRTSCRRSTRRADRERAVDRRALPRQDAYAGDASAGWTSHAACRNRPSCVCRSQTHLEAGVREAPIWRIRRWHRAPWSKRPRSTQHRGRNVPAESGHATRWLCRHRNPRACPTNVARLDLPSTRSARRSPRSCRQRCTRGAGHSAERGGSFCHKPALRGARDHSRRSLGSRLPERRGPRVRNRLCPRCGVATVAHRGQRKTRRPPTSRSRRSIVASPRTPTGLPVPLANPYRTPWGAS